MPTFPLGRTKDPVDPNDHTLAMHRPLLAASVIPSYWPMPTLPILDQGAAPACVAFSGSTYRTAQEKKDERHTIAWCENDFYANCKKIDGAPNEDGTYLRAGAQVLSTTGEEIRASSVSSEVGEYKKITSYARLSNRTEIKQAIMQTGGAWVGLLWYNSWFTTSANGTVPKPDHVAGGHAIYIGGWSDYYKRWSGQNSWGTVYGRAGHFYLPYAYLDSQLASGDADVWAITDVLGD